jgi:Kef-type K+ transport system membrane component KefB
MENSGFLVSLGWIVLAAALFLLGARWLRLPSIIAYLLAGLALGPFLGLVENSSSLHDVSELGIVLLLFLVGLELSFSQIREVGKVAVVAGLGQVVFTALGGLLFCFLLGFGWMDSLFLSVALTFSSTVVVVKILTDKNEMNSLYGRIAVGIFLVQDLVVILVLTLLTGLKIGGDGSEVQVPLWLGMLKAFGGMTLLLGVAAVASRWLLPRPFAAVAGSPPTLFIWSLAWCFALVGLAKWLGLSIELGAFFAGLSLAQLPYHRDLQHRIKPLMNFFVAVFFVCLGLGMDPSAALADSWAIILLSLFVLIGNPLIFIFIISRMGYGRETSFLTSVTVAQISEFSFIFVAMGVSAGLVGDRAMGITAMVGVITIAASAYLILYNRPLYAWLQKHRWLDWLGAREKTDEESRPGRRGHIIVVGMNTLGRALVQALHARGEQTLALDTDSRKMRGLPGEKILGSADYSDVLQDADLEQAKLVISALRIENANDLLAYRCKKAGVPCAIHAVDFSVVDNLLELDVDYLMLPKVDGVKLQAKWLKQRGILPS